MRCLVLLVALTACHGLEEVPAKADGPDAAEPAEANVDAAIDSSEAGASDAGSETDAGSFDCERIPRDAFDCDGGRVWEYGTWHACCR